MKLTAKQIVQLLGGTNAAARFFGVRPPSVTYWLNHNVIPDERLIPFAAELESKTAGSFARSVQWPERWRRIWPEMAAPAGQVAQLEERARA